jgi:Chaperone of endosialidase
MSEVYKGQVIPLYSDPADGPGSFRDLVDSGPVPRFATAAERNAAIPTPIAGQIAYRADAKAGGALEIYSAGAWKDTVAGLALTAHTHPGSNITSDIPVAHIPALPASIITSGTIAAARLPAATASVAGIIQTDHSHASVYYNKGEVNGLVNARVPFIPTASGATAGEIQNRWVFSGDPTYFKSLEVDGNVAARSYSNISTLAAKTDIAPLAAGGAFFERLSPISFRYRDDSQKRMGFAAEEMSEVAPEWVIGNGINYMGMLPDFMAWAVATIRELRSQLSSQEEDE